MNRPFPLAVIIAFGTVFALSLLMIFIVPGLPRPLYDVGAWTRGSSDMLLWLLPLLSLVGYVEAGFMHAFFTKRQAARAAAPDLVEEVGAGTKAQSDFVGKGAVAGALAGVLASLAAMPILLFMVYMELQDSATAEMLQSPDLLPMLLLGNFIAACISLANALVAGLLLGALGGWLGSRVNPAPQLA